MFKYVCVPHETLGMKGAVVVRPGGSGDGGSGGRRAWPTREPRSRQLVRRWSNYDGTTVDRTDADASRYRSAHRARRRVRLRPASGSGDTRHRSRRGPGPVKADGHNVVSDGDGPIESGDPVTVSEGHTFEYTFEESGEYKYVCVPHETLGMKGAVVVE